MKRLIAKEGLKAANQKTARKLVKSAGVSSVMREAGLSDAPTKAKTTAKKSEPVKRDAHSEYQHLLATDVRKASEFFATHEEAIFEAAAAKQRK